MNVLKVLKSLSNFHEIRCSATNNMLRKSNFRSSLRNDNYTLFEGLNELLAVIPIFLGRLR